jgi:hypothetical protein
MRIKKATRKSNYKRVSFPFPTIKGVLQKKITIGKAKKKKKKKRVEAIL